MEYGIIEQEGITVLTGEVGTGKTTTLMHTINKLQHMPITLGIANQTGPLTDNLFGHILLAFDLDFKGLSNISMLKSLQDFFIREYSKGKHCLLVIDEAQNLSRDNLEQLRLLTNINTPRDKLIQLVLVGQPELRDKLCDHNLAQFSQRIAIEYHINPLNWDETKEYIKHRLEVAGSHSSIFDESAIATIFYHSGGVPRLINTLADQCMVHAYAADETRIGLRTAVEVIKSRSISGVNRFNQQRAQVESIRRLIKEKLGVDIAT